MSAQHPLTLSQQELDSLATLEPKLQLIRDRVGSVVEQYATGFFLFGEGGTCKSYSVMEELARLGAHFIHTNSRVTGRGLFDLLNEHPDDIHLLEDCEHLLDDKNALGVLRSALHSQSTARPPERLITWNSFANNLDVVFTGAIIYIANRRLDDIPEVRAIKTRVPVLELVAGNDELAALMYKIALDGYRYGKEKLTPHEACEIVDYVIARSKSVNRNLDMRLMKSGWQDYLQWRAGRSVLHWHDLVDSRLMEHTAAVRRNRKDIQAEEAQLAHEINAMKISPKEKEDLFAQKTGHCGRTFWRRLKLEQKRLTLKTSGVTTDHEHIRMYGLGVCAFVAGLLSYPWTLAPHLPLVLLGDAAHSGAHAGHRQR